MDREKVKLPEGYRYCGFCGGTGILDRYLHIADGVCFKCEGKGTLKSVASQNKKHIDNGITPNPKYKQWAWHPDWHGRKGIPPPKTDFDCLH